MQQYWKEITLELPEKEEFNYVVKNENCNCVIIRNPHITSVLAGIKPGVHDVIVPGNQVGIISRPFPLEHVYLVADERLRVTLIETMSNNPIDNYVQQEIARDIRVTDTVGLRAIDLNRDAFNNVGVNMANAPHVFGLRWAEGSSTDAPLEVVLDTSEYGRPHVNIFIQSNVNAGFGITGGNEWHRRFFNITTHVFGAGGGVWWRHFTISFRYVRVATGVVGKHYVQITATR